MNTLTPPADSCRARQIYHRAREQAKRMVAVAVRNRWRRQQLDPALRDEIAPKNIILMAPPAWAKLKSPADWPRLTGAPFIKVEATKYTEVGYVGRDVESMIRDLMEIGIKLVRDEEGQRVAAKAEAQAEERLLDLLLPGSSTEAGREATREKLRNLWKLGHLDDHEVEVEVTGTGSPDGHVRHARHGQLPRQPDEKHDEPFHAAQDAEKAHENPRRLRHPRAAGPRFHDR